MAISARKFMLLCLLALAPAAAPALGFADSQDASALVRQAVAYWRDRTSYAEAVMTVHRPQWERSFAIKAWTSGSELSMVRFVAPPKDAGNATLTTDEEVWTFNPKTNRVVKIPPSMKSQSWMGSDFSYQDLSKDDEIADNYSHRLLREETHQGKRVYVVECTPLESAPIVWGKEQLWIREDWIIIKHLFFDQEDKLVKELAASEIREIGGKLYATLVRMSKAERSDEWTEVRYKDLRFGVDVPASFFSLSNLRNPGK